MHLVYRRHDRLPNPSRASSVAAALSSAPLIPEQPVHVAALVSALTGLTSVSLKGALCPRQWILEGLEEIEDAPADDDVIVEADKSAHLGERKRRNLLTCRQPETLPLASPQGRFYSPTAHELLRGLLSAAEAGPFRQEVFIAAAPRFSGPVRPLPPLSRCQINEED